MTRFIFNLSLAAAFAFASAGITACSDQPSNAIASPDYANAPLNLSTPQNTAYSMMIAMYRGDAKMVDAVFAEGGTLLRMKPDGTVSENGLPRWRDWVGTLEVGFAHETLFDIEVERYGKLATVWAPFVIDVEGKRVGCGVNQLTLAEMDDGWRIVTGMDVQAPQDACAAFRETYGRRQ